MLVISFPFISLFIMNEFKKNLASSFYHLTSIKKGEVIIKKAWTDIPKDAYNVKIWPSPQFRKKRHPLYLVWIRIV